MDGNPISWLIDTIISIYIYIIIASVVMSWLFAFNVINNRHEIVYNISSFLHAATEPALRPIRRALPNLGGLDISPMILIIGLIFLRKVLSYISI